MNNIRIATLKFFRTYSSKKIRPTSGIRGRLGLEKNFDQTELDIEDIECDDLSTYESDFLDPSNSYTSYKRELNSSKLRLKRSIVADKYFKEVEPNFLSFAEKDQIQKLHKSNPQEWTPERLSESYPALPETIKKILRIKWSPKTVGRVLAYDKKVAENWKNFRAGKLVTNPILMEHLMKFKNRKIVLRDSEQLAKNFIQKKIDLPKPKTSIFTNIVKDYIERKELTAKCEEVTSNVDCKQLFPPEKENTNTVIQNVDQNSQLETVEADLNSRLKTSAERIDENRSSISRHKENQLVMNEFIKEKLKAMYETSPEKGIVLLEKYKTHMQLLNKNNEVSGSSLMESKDTNANNRNPSTFHEFKKSEVTVTPGVDWNPKAIKTIAKVDENPLPMNSHNEKRLTFNEFVQEKLKTIYDKSPEEGIVLLNTYRKQMETLNNENDLSITSSIESKETNVLEPKDENTLTTRVAENSKISVKKDEEYHALDTYIKEWNKTIDKNLDYANPIQIPKNAYKMGKTYRIKDCYYDDDGEFLYRVPGVKT